VQKIADLLVDEFQKTGSPLAYWRLELIKKKFAVVPSPDQQKRMESRGPAGTFVANAAFAGSFDALFLGDKELRISSQQSAVTASSTRLRSIPLSSVTPLEIPPHIWITGTATSSSAAPMPELFGAAPADRPVIYARKLSVLRDTSLLFDTVGAFPAELFPLAGYENMYARILGRLGVADPQMLERASDDVLFVADDLSFVPSTNFALIIRPSGVLASVQGSLVSGVGIRGSVGNFFVLSTSQDLLNRIASTASGSDALFSPLRNEADFRYAWNTLRAPRDGFAFLSERTMRRLVAPASLINMHRREDAARRIDILQHWVFAYRSITGKWPTTFADMVKEGYVDARLAAADPELFETLDQYTIDQAGVVTSKEWGTLTLLRPLSEVPFNMVTPAEAAAYKNVWSRDPEVLRLTSFAGAGVTFTLNAYFVAQAFVSRGNSLWPLAPLEDIFGGNPHELTTIDQIPTESSVIFAGSIDPERLLLDSAWGEPFRLSIASTTPPLLSASTTANLRARYAALPREQQQKSALDALAAYARDVGLNELVDPLGMFGNEVLFGIPTSGVGTSTLMMGGYAGLKLKNVPPFRQLLHDLYVGLAKTIGGVENPREPEQKGSGSGAYTVFPTGIASLYATFLNDRAYASLDESTMVTLVKSLSGKSVALSPLESALLAYIGRTKNFLSVFDFGKSDTPGTLFIADPEHWTGYVDIDTAKGGELGAYLADVHDVAIVLSGNSFAPEQYFVPIANHFLGLPFDLSDGRVRFGGTDIAAINFTTASGTSNKSWSSLYTPEDRTRLASGLTRMGGLGIGLTFTAPGALIDVAIPSPFASSSPESAPSEAGFHFPTIPFVVVWYLLGIAVVGGGIWGVALFTRRMKGTKTIAEVIAENIEKRNNGQ
jgi:hypothetical protein